MNDDANKRLEIFLKREGEAACATIAAFIPLAYEAIKLTDLKMVVDKLFEIANPIITKEKFSEYLNGEEAGFAKKVLYDTATTEDSEIIVRLFLLALLQPVYAKEGGRIKIKS